MVRAMSKPIRRVAVLGSGVMGGGIAAHVANAGLPVILLDLQRPQLDKLLKAKPAAFFHPRNAALVTTGTFDADLAKVATCDLVIEAIIERLDVKQQLFERLEKIVGPDTIVASNTSGLRIADMLAGRSEAFRKSFVVTHFFNPPRYMKLLELVAGPETSIETRFRAEAFGRDVLGKGIVWAKDTPNFIANRIGAHSMMAAIHLMLERGLSPEDLDAITGLPMGHPKSAIFRTGDVVGLDTLGHVVANCHAVLVNDEDRAVFATPPYIARMIERGQLGDKTKGGFYKKVGDDIQTLDPKTGEYRARGGDAAIADATKKLSRIDDVRERVKQTVAAPGVVGEVAWAVLARSLAYAARRIGEITDSIKAIDDGMRWGYSWELGPFETWDALGFAATYDRMKKDGIALPAWLDKMRGAASGFYQGGRVWDPQRSDYIPLPTDPREATWDVMRKNDAPVLSNAGAEAWDLGDGVLGVQFKTKQNSLDADVVKMLHDAVDRAERDFRALVVFNRGDNFCVGANVMAVVMAAKANQWDALRTMCGDYQRATQRLKYATVPTVAAPFGGTMGGGLELCFGCDGVQAAAETYAGLVEVGVGLIPGGAGTMNMLWRALEAVPDGVDPDVYPFVTQVFKNIALGRVATSAGEAKAFGYFRSTDGISFDRARLLHEAKRRAIGLADAGYHPPIPRTYKLPGDSGIATLGMMINTLVAGGYASEHDATIARKLATVLCGGAGGGARMVTEDEILELEREAFVSLCGEPKTHARIQHFLTTNKMLRN
jgi:3-hydroxyacyl-CoA dehydrogenase